LPPAHAHTAYNMPYATAACRTLPHAPGRACLRTLTAPLLCYAYTCPPRALATRLQSCYLLPPRTAPPSGCAAPPACPYLTMTGLPYLLKTFCRVAFRRGCGPVTRKRSWAGIPFRYHTGPPGATSPHTPLPTPFTYLPLTYLPATSPTLYVRTRRAAALRCAAHCTPPARTPRGVTSIMVAITTHT